MRVTYNFSRRRLHGIKIVVYGVTQTHNSSIHHCKVEIHLFKAIFLRCKNPICASRILDSSPIHFSFYSYILTGEVATDSVLNILSLFPSTAKPRYTSDFVLVQLQFCVGANPCKYNPVWVELRWVQSRWVPSPITLDWGFMLWFACIRHSQTVGGLILLGTARVSNTFAWYWL